MCILYVRTSSVALDTVVVRDDGDCVASIARWWEWVSLRAVDPFDSYSPSTACIEFYMQVLFVSSSIYSGLFLLLLPSLLSDCFDSVSKQETGTRNRMALHVTWSELGKCSKTNIFIFMFSINATLKRLKYFVFVLEKWNIVIYHSGWWLG